MLSLTEHSIGTMSFRSLWNVVRISLQKIQLDIITLLYLCL